MVYDLLSLPPNTHLQPQGCTWASVCYNVHAMVTKRQLGIITIVLGLLVILGITAVDFVGAGKWSGFGPLQQLGIGLSLAAVAVGCILVRLGDRPA
jgi:cytochrome c biogenesis protein CcdA